MQIDGPGLQERVQLLDVEQKLQAQLRDPEFAREHVKVGYRFEAIIGAFVAIAFVTFVLFFVAVAVFH